MEERFINQRNLLDEERIKNCHFVVIGAGAIGSFCVMNLAKMGARRITVYDNDTIEDHNISNQLYPIRMIGMPKVDALKEVAFDYGEAEIVRREERWHPDTAIDGDIIVSAVDNMDVRKALFEWYSKRPIRFFLDGRMSAQVFKVYGVDMASDEQKEFYRTTLYPQSEAAPEPCGEKSIIYNVLAVSSFMLSVVKQWLMSEYRPTEIVVDMLNFNVTKKYFMKQVIEIIESEEEEIENEEAVVA